MQLVSGNPYSPTVFANGSPVQKPWAGQLPVFFQLDAARGSAVAAGVRRMGSVLRHPERDEPPNVEGREYDQVQGKDVDVPGLPIIPFIGVEFIPR